MKCTLSQADSIHKYTYLFPFLQSLLFAALSGIRKICKICMLIYPVNHISISVFCLHFNPAPCSIRSFCIQIRFFIGFLWNQFRTCRKDSVFCTSVFVLNNNFSVPASGRAVFCPRKLSMHLLSPPEVPRFRPRRSVPRHTFPAD